MQGEYSLNKNAYGRHHVAVDVSSIAYTALTDTLSRPIPFQINAAEDVLLSVKMVDDTAYANHFFSVGDNPDLVIAIDVKAAVDAGTISAIYPYKPATTTIKTTY